MVNARENSRAGHVFREGPFRRRKAVWIDGSVLHWRIGRQAKHCQLSEIARIALDAGRGRCVIHLNDGKMVRVADLYWFTWQSGERHRLGTRERRRATFDNFVARLMARTGKA